MTDKIKSRVNMNTMELRTEPSKPLGRAPLLALSVLLYIADYFGFVLKDETC